MTYGTAITRHTTVRPPMRSVVRPAFTLVEVLGAVVILAILSVAICSLTFAAMNDDRYLRSVTTSQSEIELAMRRITNNIREAQTGSITYGTSTLTTLTQGDAADGYPLGASVTYSLQADAVISGQQNLVENDQRFGTNVILHNVTTFTVAPVSGISDLYQVDLVVGSGTIIAERHFKVLGRN